MQQVQKMCSRVFTSIPLVTPLTRSKHKSNACPTCGTCQLGLSPNRALIAWRTRWFI